MDYMELDVRCPGKAIKPNTSFTRWLILRGVNYLPNA